MSIVLDERKDRRSQLNYFELQYVTSVICTVPSRPLGIDMSYDVCLWTACKYVGENNNVFAYQKRHRLYFQPRERGREGGGGVQHILPPFTGWHGLSKKPFIRPSEQSAYSVPCRQFSCHITQAHFLRFQLWDFSSHDFHTGGLAKEVNVQKSPRSQIM